jgi:hypothetical protein
VSYPHENDPIPRDGESQADANMRDGRNTMFFIAGWILLCAVLWVVGSVFAGPVTAICQDGTKSHANHHMGTCSWHGGVAQWVAP